MRTLIVFLFLALASQLSAEDKPDEKPLTNDDVIQLVAVKLGDTIVVAKIADAPAEALDVSTDSLIALKKKGVSDVVIDAIMKRVAARQPARSLVEPAAAVAETSPEPEPPPTGRMAKMRSWVKSAVTREPDEPEASGTEADSRPCVKNFTSEGSFFKGKTFKTKVYIGTIPTAVAFPRVTQYLACSGWRMATSDKDSGVVTATQDVAWSDGKTAPLSVIVKTIEGRTWIAISFSIGAGTGSPQDAVIREFCATRTRRLMSDPRPRL